MNAVPARVAGVPRIAMVVPSPGGEMNPLVLAAAQLAGVDEIYRIGGAQAVAALAYGTESVRAGRQDRRPRQCLRRRRQAPGVRHGRHRFHRRAVGGAGHRRQRQRSRVARRRPAGAGRARHRRPGHPDDRRRRPCRAREGSRRAPARRAAARQYRRRELGDLRRRDRAAVPRRGPAARRPHRRRAPRDRHPRSRSPRRAHPQRRRHLPRRAHAGGDRRLRGGLQPRAADRAQRPLLLGPRRARLHEAHVHPEARPRARSRRWRRPP